MPTEPEPTPGSQRPLGQTTSRTRGEELTKLDIYLTALEFRAQQVIDKGKYYSALEGRRGQPKAAHYIVMADVIDDLSNVLRDDRDAHHRPSPGPVVSEGEIQDTATRILKRYEYGLEPDHLEPDGNVTEQEIAEAMDDLTALITRAGGRVVTEDEIERALDEVLCNDDLHTTDETRVANIKAVAALITRAGGRVVDRNMLITVIANVMDGCEDLVTTDAIADAILTALSSRPAADGEKGE